MLLLKIMGGLVALALGVWLGLPGRYEQKASEIEEILGQPGRRPRRKVKRRFTPLAWIQRKAQARERPLRARFRLAVPGEED